MDVSVIICINHSYTVRTRQCGLDLTRSFLVNLLTIDVWRASYERRLWGQILTMLFCSCRCDTSYNIVFRRTVLYRVCRPSFTYLPSQITAIFDYIILLGVRSIKLMFWYNLISCNFSAGNRLCVELHYGAKLGTSRGVCFSIPFACLKKLNSLRPRQTGWKFARIFRRTFNFENVCIFMSLKCASWFPFGNTSSLTLVSII